MVVAAFFLRFQIFPQVFLDS